MELEQLDVLSQAPVFNVDNYHVGAAIYIKTPKGERFHAIICDSGYEYIHCYHLDNISFKPVLLEIELEEYMKGDWIIQRVG